MNYFERPENQIYLRMQCARINKASVISHTFAIQHVHPLKIVHRKSQRELNCLQTSVLNRSLLHLQVAHLKEATSGIPPQIDPKTWV